MQDHDPIREWHAQKERVNELLTICNTARSGDMEPDVCLAALIVGGVDERLAKMALAACAPQAPEPPQAPAETPRDAQPERLLPSQVVACEAPVAQAAAEIDSQARAGTRCLVAGEGLGLASDALLALTERGWTWCPAKSLLAREGAVIRVARSVDACRGPNVGAVWLVGASPKMRKQASMVLRQVPGVMLVTPAEPVLPDGWRWGETDGPGIVRAYRDHADGGYCRFDETGFSEIRAAPGVRAAVEGRARRLGLLTGGAEPVLPPGCTLSRSSAGWWTVIGRDGQPMIWTVLSNEAAVAAASAWERFGAFMSREDYETLAAADLREEATAKRLDDALAAIRGAHLALDVAGTSSDGTLVERIGRLVCEHWRKLEAEHDATHAAGLRAERAEARAAADASVAVAHDALSEAGVERFTTALGQGGPSKRALTLIERVRLLSGKVSDAEAEVVRLRSGVADVRKDRDNACHRVDVLEDELREAHEARRSLAHAVDRLRAEARSRPANRNDPDPDHD